MYREVVNVYTMHSQHRHMNRKLTHRLACTSAFFCFGFTRRVLEFHLGHCESKLRKAKPNENVKLNFTTKLKSYETQKIIRNSPTNIICLCFEIDTNGLVQSNCVKSCFNKIIWDSNFLVLKGHYSLNNKIVVSMIHPSCNWKSVALK